MADSSGEADGRGSDRSGDRSGDRAGDRGSGRSDATDRTDDGATDGATDGTNDGMIDGGADSPPLSADEPDPVARVLSQWQQAYPSLDTAPLGVIGRLHRCAALLRQADGAPLSQEGLSRAEFDILGALRRAQHELTPGHLGRETSASSAAVTKRIKELERRGLVVRRADDRDRRVVHLSLTEAGRTLIDRLLPDQLGYEASLLAGLPAARQHELAGVLAQLLSVLEGRVGNRQGQGQGQAQGQGQERAG